MWQLTNKHTFILSLLFFIGLILFEQNILRPMFHPEWQQNPKLPKIVRDQHSLMTDKEFYHRHDF
jgi:hypothetical protein